MEVTYTKETTLGAVADNNKFKFSKRKSAAVWKIVLRDHPDLKNGKIVYTSERGGRSDIKDAKTKVYVS